VESLYGIVTTVGVLAVIVGLFYVLDTPSRDGGR